MVCMHIRWGVGSNRIRIRIRSGFESRCLPLREHFP
jgi:hypothetical protein